MIAARDIEQIIGSEAVDAEDDRIGTVSQVYLDEDNARPTWVSVRTGLFGLSESLVPLEQADWDEQALHVSVTRDRVKHAPHVSAHDELTIGDQERLYAHYEIEPTEAVAGQDDVCYAIHEDAPDAAELEETVQDAESNVSGHMLAPAGR